MPKRKPAAAQPQPREQKRIGRPRQISDATIKAICDQVATGRTLAEVCRDAGMPNVATVYRRIDQSSSLREAFARARESCCLVMADEIKAIADDSRNDWVERERANGRGSVTVLNDEHVRRSQLRIDARKWLLARLLPHRFGDRVESIIQGPNGGPVQVEHTASAAMLAGLASLRDRLPAPVTLDGELSQVQE